MNIRYILRKKNQISFISFGLIVFAYFSKWILQNEIMFTYSLIVASVIGVLPIAIQAYQSLRIKLISIDVLVTVAVIGAFIIKEYAESAIVTFLFLFGAFLEQRTLNKTHSAIKSLTQMAPVSALKLNETREFVEVSVDEVYVNDTLLVKTGAKVPVDGIIISGEGYLDEATITGESKPAHKTVGEGVFAGTILENGTIQIKANKVGEDTTFNKIIALVEEAQDAKSKTERFIDRFSKYYTPGVLLFALIVYLITFDIPLAITILVLGCPGALVIGVPVSNVAGIGNGAKHGVLLKGSEVIQEFSKVKTIVFDKTGTLTFGKPQVVDVKYYTKDEEKANKYLSSIEKESDHPLAKAITAYIGDIENLPVTSTSVVKGQGIIAKINEDRIVVGNNKLMIQENVHIDESIQKDISDFEGMGNSLVLMAINGKIEVLLGIRDAIRPNTVEHLTKLKTLGINKLILLSGDNQGTVDRIAQELGITISFGNMLPQDKAKYIKELQLQGEHVAFVGDGVNDSPSLAQANIGIAVGSGTDVAIETSDIVLMHSELSSLPFVLGLAKTTKNNMVQNIVIAIGVVIILLLSVFLSTWMNMSIGMLVHESSILLVILNGMRLLKYKLRKG
ncbi:MAG: heavy metal translocating P-type ATPase [Bacilli bacterium]|nr:heavy metal translocating P-type ATPase [Bacilli bacterium]HHU24761.1 heavy metal translocating P-type ATPase [Acholeplasmataceae bacterium]